MFYGTRFIYNVLYFITAMTPAYFLFLLQINQKFKNPLDVSIYGVEINIYTWCFILFIIFFLLTLLLKWLLKEQYTKGRGKPVSSFRLKNFSKDNIESLNGNVVYFLLGNILPGVLIMETSIAEAVIVFILLQIMIYILVIKSSDVFPNVALVILGIELCKTRNGDYLLVLKGEEEEVKIYQIGDVRKSRLYITMSKK